MALTNAEKQKRWRDRRNELANILTGTPRDVAEGIFSELGAKKARNVARALDKRLRNLKPDCPKCHGEGFYLAEASTACDSPLGVNLRFPCDCGDVADRVMSDLR